MMLPFSRLAFLASFVACTFGTQYPEIVYVQDLCSLSIQVHGDIRIQLARTKYIPNNLDCDLVFRPNKSQYLTARFLKYHSYYPGPDYDPNFCATESIQLYNVVGNSELSLDADYCSQDFPPNIYQLGASGRFHLFTGTPGTDILTNEVDLLVTEVTQIFSSQPLCPDGFFNCTNNYCVLNSVICNGFDDCGNNMDELQNCGSDPTPQFTPGIIAGISAGCFVILILVVTTAVAVYKSSFRDPYTQRI